MRFTGCAARVRKSSRRRTATGGCALGKGDDARLLYYLHLAHGTGRAYTVVTITADTRWRAWETLAGASRPGISGTWAHDVDQLRHEVNAKILLPVTWATRPSRPQRRSRPSTPPRSRCSWKTPRGRTKACSTTISRRARPVRTQPRRSATRRAVAAGAAGRVANSVRAGRRSEVVLWQRVRHPERVTNLIYDRDSPRVPGTGHVDARRAAGPRRLGEPVAAHHQLVAPVLIP